MSARARLRAVSVDVRAVALAADVFLQEYWLCHLIISLGGLTSLHRCLCIFEVEESKREAKDIFISARFEGILIEL